MKKITFFICSLSSGGAEHQLTILADYLVEKEYDVSIVTFSNIPDHYKYNTKINRINLYCGNYIKTFARIFLFFLRNNTDCVISFGSRENFLTLLPLLFKPKQKIINGERCATFSKIPFYRFD